jgi:hypothetical protein
LIPELIADGGSVVAFVWAVRNPYLNLKALAASSSRGAEFVPWRNAACQAGRSISAMTQEFDRASLLDFRREEAASYRGERLLVRAAALGSRVCCVPGRKSKSGAR